MVVKQPAPGGPNNPNAKSAPSQPKATTNPMRTPAELDDPLFAKKGKAKKPRRPRTTKQKMLLTALIFIAIILIAGTITTIVLLMNNKFDGWKIGAAEFDDPVYSILTGEEIKSADLNKNPTYCVQIPNGSTDGARPQAGLGQAGVVFEAIAERGITRFAAVFQNATASAIGPVRSLRSYYLDWDTPFDCTVVHAGGSNEALADIRVGGQRNLDESYEYMWREESNRAWNNLFTSPADIAKFNSDMGYNSSNPKTFPRATPEETDVILAETKTCAADDAECTPTPLVEKINISFGAIPMYNTVYTYDRETNSYLRSYADGTAHVSYNCPAGLSRPDTTSACGEPVQLAPRAVVAMFVQESTSYDGYHEDIRTLGSGTAIVFQNGRAFEAKWSKDSQDSQIVFRDAADAEIKFTPGQLWIAAVPQQYGRVGY